jgi:hypothetical protein
LGVAVGLGCRESFLLTIIAQKCYTRRMLNFTPLLSTIQAAIAVVAAREQMLTALLVVVWGRIGRIGARLERLIMLWRAGMVPKARVYRGRVAGTQAAPRVRIVPVVPGWLLVAVRDAAPFGNRLEAMLSKEECAAFLAAVPQARRLLGPLCRMLGVGVKAIRTGRVRAVWMAPKSASTVAQAALVVGPGGRLMYV